MLMLTGIQQFSAALMFPSRTKRQDSSIDDVSQYVKHIIWRHFCCVLPYQQLADQLRGQMIGDLGVTIFSVTVL